MKKLLLIISLILPFCSIAQVVEIDDKIIMTGTSDSQKKITDLGTPIDGTSAVSEQFFLSGNVNYANCTGANDTFQLSVFPIPLAIRPGMIISFIAPFTNDNKVYAEINNSGIYYSLTKKGIDPLDTSDIISGQAVSMIFDGTRFQVFSELNKSCPVGFIKASADYCIQPLENAAVFFWTAIKNCGKQNSRVCNWGEWYYACLNSTTLGVAQMLNNWEWVDAGGNSLGWTTPATSDTGMQVGNAGGTCINAMSSIVDTTHTHMRADPKAYRCCYSLIR